MDDEALPTRSSLSPGVVIAGKYRLESRLAEGGMGVVWKATQLDLERAVAIKVVREELTEVEEVVQRTLDEAREAARLRGEHIVRILDVGRIDSGAPYIVMEHLQGHDLFDMLRALPEPVPVERAVDIVLEACEGLAEAHAIGLVHRDLKPENLFLAEQPDGSLTVKLLDFGISERANDAHAIAAPPTTVFGSPQYMAPEQMKGAINVDVRADIWSLGATLYELLAGRAPFTADKVSKLIKLVLEKEPASVRSLRKELPAALDAVVMKCLQKDPSSRFSDVEQLARALAPFGGPSAFERASRVARLLSGTVTRPSVPVATSRSVPARPEARSPWRRRGVLSLVAAALLGSLFVAGLAIRTAWKERHERIFRERLAALAVPPVPADVDAGSDAAEDDATAPVPSAEPTPVATPEPPQRKSEAARRQWLLRRLAEVPADAPAQAPSTPESAPDAWDPANFGGRR